ncbi:MAG: carboxypeptidase regulatory-like domain-containing protein [Chitinophagales bacterium]|nr:carboxypeptidase regulatory-like domain-containing protein [Chitinophagales bacterium]
MEQPDLPYNNDELDKLLKQYLLEAERDRLADEALEAHAEFIFSEEASVLPSAAKEQELLGKLQNAFPYERKAPFNWAKGLMVLSAVLLIGICGYLFIPSQNDKQVASIEESPSQPEYFEKAPFSPGAPTLGDSISDNGQTILWIPRPPDMPLNNSTIQVPAPLNHLATISVSESMRGLMQHLLADHYGYLQKVKSEIVYVKTDRDVYQPGDDMYLSIFVRDEASLKPSPISEIVKLQLLDANKKPIIATQVVLENGFAKAHLSLANALPEGLYQLTAHTDWQLNQASQSLFSKNILLAEPIHYSSFDSSQITALSGNTLLTEPVNTTLNHDLQIDQIEVGSTVAELKIHSTLETKAILFGQVRGQIYYNKIIDLKPGINTIEVALKSFPTGNALFTLFNPLGEAISTRQVPVNAAKGLQINLSFNKLQYHIREKVKLQVSVKDAKGNPSQGRYVVSVTDNKPLSQMLGNETKDIQSVLTYQSSQHLSVGGNAQQGLTLYRPARKVFSGIIIDELSGQPLKGVAITVNGTKGKTTTDAKGRFTLNGIDLSNSRELSLSYKLGLMTFVINRYEEDLLIPFSGDNRRLFQPSINSAFHPVIAGGTPISEGGVLLGQVTDLHGMPVPFAHVSVNNYTKVYQATCDGRGFYTFTDLGVGQYEVMVDAQGYESQKSNLVFKKGDAAILDIQLPLKVNVAPISLQHRKISPNQRYGFLKPELRWIAAKDKASLLKAAPEENKAALLDFFRQMDSVSAQSYYLKGNKIKANEPYTLSFRSLKQMGMENGLSARYANTQQAEEARLGLLDTRLMEELSYPANDKSIPSSFKLIYHQSADFKPTVYGTKERVTKPSDFRATLYWNGDVHLDENGEALIEFFAGDDLSNYIVSVEGIDDEGQTGQANAQFKTILPYGVKAELPVLTEVTKHIKVPLTFDNFTGYQVNGVLEMHFPPVLTSKLPSKQDFTIFPARKDTIWLDLEVDINQATDNATITFTANGYIQTLTLLVRVDRKEPD